MNNLEKLLELAAQRVKYGQLTVNVDVHDGQIRSYEGAEHTQLNYVGDGSQKAVEDLLRVLAQDRQLAKTGKLTFTFDFKSGQIKKLFIYRQVKHPLTK